MLTEMETMTELAEIKSEIVSSDGYHGSGSGSVDSNSSSATPQPHHNNFSWVSEQLFIEDAPRLAPAPVQPQSPPATIYHKLINVQRVTNGFLRPNCLFAQFDADKDLYEEVIEMNAKITNLISDFGQNN